MNRFHYKILSVFIISLSLFTFPTNAKEYSSEIGTLWNFTVSKQINRINLQIQQNVWTLGKYYERYMPIAVVSYTAVPKYLKLNALYYYMNQQTAPNIYSEKCHKSTTVFIQHPMADCPLHTIHPSPALDLGKRNIPAVVLLPG